MNRGVNYQSSLVQHMMGANPNSWWNMSNLLMPSPDQQTSAAEPSSASSHPMTLWSDSQEQLPESWSQLLLGSGLVMGHEERCSLAPFVSRQMENWEDQAVAYPLTGSDAVGEIKQETSESGYLFSNRSAEDAQTAARASWGHQALPASSPRSCIATSFGDNVLDFSNVNKGERRQHQSDHSSECNNSISTGAVFKKARVHSSPLPQPTFKVRKEKLGDRITALHQLVSPFGKTDTASVLLEAIGYIRFLQGQIQALSSPYLARAGSAGNLRQQPLLDDNCMQKRGPLDQADSKDQPKKDLRSRGLCLVPLSCTLHVGSDNGADYWAPNFGTGSQ